VPFALGFYPGGGWALLEEGAERAAVRVGPDDSGRLRVRELHLLDSGQPITAERLRVAAVEQLLNLPEERAEIEKLLGRRPSLDVEAVVARFAAVDAVTPSGLGTVHVKRGGAAASISASGAIARGLRAPPQRGYPDDFYSEVAATYRPRFGSVDRATSLRSRPSPPRRRPPHHCSQVGQGGQRPHGVWMPHAVA
jgi:hypothetical protein